MRCSIARAALTFLTTRGALAAVTGAVPTALVFTAVAFTAVTCAVPAALVSTAVAVLATAAVPCALSAVAGLAVP